VHAFADLESAGGGYWTQAYQGQQFAPDRHTRDYIGTSVLMSMHFRMGELFVPPLIIPSRPSMT
jgi:hypothetical protein